MNGSHMQHGEDWSGQDLTGWHMSEKLNGCRAYWDGNILWSRSGFAATLPRGWRAELPAMALDCELYDGQSGAYRCTAAMRGGHFEGGMYLVVFDAPTAPGDWPARLARAGAALYGSGIAKVIDWRVCRGQKHAFDALAAIQGAGGEGLMFRAPGLAYAAGRTAQVLKLKSAERVGDAA